MSFKLLITTLVSEDWRGGDGSVPAPSSVVAEFETKEEALAVQSSLIEDTSHEFIRYWATFLWPEESGK